MESLEIPPKSSDPFFWADFVELRALIHPDRCFSLGDLSSLAKRIDDTGHNRRFIKNIEPRWNDMASFAAVRQHEFGSAYPFKLSEDKDTLELDLEQLENNQKKSLYLGLLLSSLMRHFPKNETGNIGKYFEEISFYIFQSLMPSGSEVRATYANGGSYQGSLFQKMTEVANDIRCTANFKDRDFKKNDTGDGGIDLISWHPMTDRREGMPIAFAQCGCSKSDWTFKQLEASPAKHGRHLPVMHSWATYYFLPLDLRDPDGDWAYKSDIGAAIIIDRLRMMRLAEQYNLYDELPILSLLEQVMAIEYA